MCVYLVVIPMKNTTASKKLKLNLSTVRVLTPTDMSKVAGGGGYTESGCSFCDTGNCTARVR